MLNYGNKKLVITDIVIFYCSLKCNQFPASMQPLSKHGDIQVSLNYNQSLQRLTVVVLRARGLQCSSNAGEVYKY